MMKTPLSNAWLPRLAYCLTFSFSFSFTVNNLLPFTLSYYSRLHHSWYYMISFIFIISIYTFLPKLNYMILLHTMKPIACRYDNNNNILKLFCAKPWGEFSDNMPRQGSWIPLTGGWCKQMQEVAGERGGYLHGRGGNNPPSLSLSVCYPFFLFLQLHFIWVYAALDSDDLLYLKEQMEAEEDAERLLRRTEKRAFAAFKISF